MFDFCLEKKILFFSKQMQNDAVAPLPATPFFWNRHLQEWFDEKPYFVDVLEPCDFRFMLVNHS